MTPRHALSPAQERMWFLQTIDPQSVAYLIVTAHRVRGPSFDERALERALALLMARHEMLRSSFPDDAGKPYRTIDDDAAPPLAVRDLAPAPPDALEACIAAEIRADANRAFDLAAAPLFRVSVLRVSSGDRVLIATFHHLIADGWSLGLFYRELALAYAAARTGGAPALPAPPPGPDTYLQREAARLTSAAGAAALDAVVDGLRDAPALELPMAHARPAVTRFSGRRHELTLDAGVAAHVAQLARELRTSSYVVLAGAFAALLHAYSGQDDLVFGSPVANRPDPDLEHAIGLFVNSVVLRVDLSGRPSFREAVARTRRVALAALERQAIPFERVVERLAPQRTLSHNPVFQVMFAFQDAHGAPLRLADLDVAPLPAGDDVARFDLELTVRRDGDALAVRLVSNTEIVDEPVAAAMLQHFRNVVGACAADPDACVTELRLTTAAERTALLARERGPAPAGAPACLHDLVREHAARAPDALALRAGPESLTFGELADRAARTAGALHARGVHRGDVVGIRLPRSAALVVALLGVLEAGGTALVLNDDEPRARTHFMLRDAGARCMLATRGADAPDGVLALDADAAAHAPPFGPAATSPDDAAYVVYTSGTTGLPKGVVVEHRNVVNTLRACAAYYRFRADDVGLVLAPHTFDVFYYELFSVLLAGGTSVLATREELLDPARLAALTLAATCVQAVTGLMEHVLGALRLAGVASYDRMRCVVTGGDLVPPALLDTLCAVFPAATVAVTYGPTECAIFCTGHVARRDRAAEGHPIGFPLPGTVVRVGDARGEPLPDGVPGEIWIGGAGVARGYLARPAENRRGFVVVGDERFYRSGDRGRYGPAGIEFLGRADRQIKIRGFRIELGEVESALARAPNVARAVVVPRGETAADRHLAAFVVLADTAPADASAKVAHWRSLFDQTYDARARHVSGEHDFTGWNESATGRPIAVDQLEEWLSGTLAAIRAAAAPGALAAKALRVLEIGCGTGLVLQGLAPWCARYVAVDVSARALADARAAAERAGLGECVVLRHAAADQLGDVGTDFDLVVLNSVVQYFPGEVYLRAVLEDALARTRPGGAVFVGDVRNLALAETFHLATEAAREPGPRDARRRVARAKRSAADEGELLVDQRWFARFAETAGHAACASVAPRHGRSANELTRYRYDAVLRRVERRPAPADAVPVQAWDAGGWTLERLQRVLAEQRPAALALTAIPNALLRDDLVAVAELLAAAGEPAEPVAGGGVAAEDLRALAAAAGYRAHLGFTASGKALSLVLLRAGVPDAPPPPRAAPAEISLVNDPLRGVSVARSKAAIRAALAARLPEYMLPATLTVIDALPLTPNGKVDRDALVEAPVERDSGRRPPRTPSERLVAAVWSELLGVDEPAAGDDFFEIGGTSLLAIQVAVALSARGVPLAPQLLFEYRTLEGVAARLDAVGNAPPAEPAGPAPPPAALAVLDRRPASEARTGDLLLTGATGMLGVHLLAELLSREPRRIVCLVRASDDAAARQRVADQLRWYFPDGPVLGDQVVAVAGDLCRARLGLSDRRWAEVAATCGTIVHAAADVRHVGEPAEIAEANVGGTRRLLELARAGGAMLHHVSTVGVKGRLPDGAAPVALTEGALEIHQQPTEAYSASKLAAERLVRAFVAQRGRAAVYRVGTVGPHSITGRFQRNIDGHFFSRYVRGAIALGIVPDRTSPRHALAPVDVLAHAVLALGAAPDAAGRTFHLVTPHELSHPEIAAMLLAMGYAIRLVPDDEFAGVLAALARDPRNAGPAGGLWPVAHPGSGTRVAIDATWTAARLEGLGIAFPAPTQAWFERFVRGGIALGYFEPPVGATLEATRGVP